ncbi:dihydroneopterin aldolase [bacterium SCSIO 12741]|nr:dihydroneopterin aldolase [bacterium SCSIO 12741]
MLKVSVHELEIKAFHGVYPEEAENGNTFLINIDVWQDQNRGVISDQVEDTLDYTQLIELAEAEMAQRSHLLEHVAQRIIDRIKKQFSPINRIKVQITKCYPPIPQKTKGVSVTLEE